jgi:predicted O-methyltransferase YrrM
VEESRRCFGDAWAHADLIPGWLTRDQAAALFDAACALAPGSTAIEIGSHEGRSTIVLAAGLGPGSRLVAVDPFDPEWRYGGPDTQRRLTAHLAAAGVHDRVQVLTLTSRAARTTYDGSVDLLYIDGKHDYWTVRDDLGWTLRMSDDSTVLVHDAFSSFGVTLGLLSAVFTSDRLVYRGRVGSLARLTVGRPSLRDRLRVLDELPWFGRNLTVKVLLRLRLQPATRLLGHHLEADPY